MKLCTDVKYIVRLLIWCVAVYYKRTVKLFTVACAKQEVMFSQCFSFFCLSVSTTALKLVDEFS